MGELTERDTELLGTLVPAGGRRGVVGVEQPRGPVPARCHGRAPPQAGLTTGDVEEAATKRVLSTRAAEACILESSEKIGTASRFRVLPWEKVSGVIRDADPCDAVVEQVMGLGVEVLTTG